MGAVAFLLVFMAFMVAFIAAFLLVFMAFMVAFIAVFAFFIVFMIFMTREDLVAFIVAMAASSKVRPATGKSFV